jgi:hypothetical protein
MCSCVEVNVGIGEVRIWGLGAGHKLFREKTQEKKRQMSFDGFKPTGKQRFHNESNFLPTQPKEPTAKTQPFQRNLCLCRLLSKVI